MVATQPIDHDGLRSLAQLGHPALIVLSTRTRRSRAIVFRLPRHAAQGPSHWYRVRLHFRADVSGSGQGFGYVNVITGHGVTASTEFVTPRRKPPARMSWNTVNTAGERKYTATRRVVDVDFRNYIVESDVSSGIHRLVFQLQQYRGLRFRRVAIRADSGVERTSVSPYPMTLRLTASPPAGGASSVVAVLANTTTKPITGVKLLAMASKNAMIVGPRDVRWPSVPSGGRVHKAFSIVARYGARGSVDVVGASSKGVVHARLKDIPVVQAPAPSETRGDRSSSWAPVGVLAGCVAGLGAIARRRKLRGSRGAPARELDTRS